MNLNLCLIHSLNIIVSVIGINHWILTENGRILQKIDSPFFLREPHNLLAFLEQIKHNDIVENTYLELLRQRKLMVEQINYSIQFGLEVIDEAKCAIDYYAIENTITPELTRKYLSRLGFQRKKHLQKSKSLPFCWRYLTINDSICCFAHLNGLINTRLLHMEPEEELKDAELEFNTDNFVANILDGLETNPSYWKYYTLSSYFWRMNGDAHQAIECAKRAFLLAPRNSRDIALLSLGTILWRSDKFKEADIILTAAVDHAPDIAENHFALGITLATLFDFNRSVEHFEQAEKLDSSFIPKTKSFRNFVSCVENLNKKTAKMYSYVEYIKKEVNGLKMMKNKIFKSHEKLVQQQIPLGGRPKEVNISSEELAHRGQYCSQRTLSGASSPVLVCDFYSDLQMRLQSKDVDIESLEVELAAKNEAIIRKLSSNFHEKFKRIISGKL